MICTYIYRYIYKVASKNGFLICNACSHSHSPTLHLFQRYSLFFCFSLSFHALFSFYSFIIKRVLEDERSSLSFFNLSKALSKVLCVNSLRYLQERLALQHLLPAVPSRCVIVREDPEDSGASYPEIATMYGDIEWPTASWPRDNRVSACVWHSSLHELISFRMHSYAFCLPYCLVRTGYGIVVAPSPL